MTSQETATLVVGASTAGALTAHLLAAKGLPVTLIDGADTPGDEQRTLIVTDRLLTLVGAELAESCIRDRVHRFEMRANGVIGIVELESPDLVIERSVLILELLSAARRAGAVILPGHRFVRFEADGSAVVRGPAGEACLDSPAVVGADGARSLVASNVGVTHRQLSLLQALVERPEDLAPGTSRVWFRPELTPYFIWMIPDGPKKVAVGLIVRTGGNARPLLDAFLREQRLQDGDYQAAKVPAYSGWVPIHRRFRGRDVYLVGDAGAQVKVSTVGGVVTGLRAAVAAAEMISSRPAWSERAGLRVELRLHALLRRALDGFGEQEYARLLQAVQGRVARGLAGSTRDSSGALVTRALITSPSIGILGLRGLLRGSQPL